MNLEALQVGRENVFDDLELPDAEELAVKAKIVHKISGIIRGRHLTQQESRSMRAVSAVSVARVRVCHR